MGTLREQLADQLRPLLPAAWKLVDVERNVDATNTPVVQLKLGDIAKTDAAPQGMFTSTWTITIISPHQDITKAEYQLDDDVIDLLFALDTIPGVQWSAAKKVAVDETRLGWDITTEMHVQKEA
ncbi:hypothetical protein QMG83_14510 [Salinibacterium sp. G-O1]|uniref:hypothetical protein n=1 Tax=Salinibacterium sp. G-O1 TaxID=3046208 RepID=UPI0024BA4909|nr:hypothetical protein [Salinibacterium sp. G-O1]MDJ0336436.1 hypothetical protein [Salinibacterium sp. G-O1]